MVGNTIYLILALQTGFYGEVITTLYFVIMQPVGLYVWIINALKPTTKAKIEDIEAQSLTLLGWIKYIAFTAIIWIGMGYIYQSIGSARPFRDSVTDSTNAIGQALQTNLYWEQWIFWLGTNILVSIFGGEPTSKCNSCTGYIY